MSNRGLSGYFQTLDSNGKFIFIVTMPIWGPFVAVLWILQALVYYIFIKAKLRRQIAKQTAPDRARLAQEKAWREQREQRAEMKAAPRPTTNTLYGGTAPMEKPLGD